MNKLEVFSLVMLSLENSILSVQAPLPKTFPRKFSIEFAVFEIVSSIELLIFSAVLLIAEPTVLIVSSAFLIELLTVQDLIGV